MDRKVMLKRFCAAVLCLVASMVAAYAVPADRTPFTVTKADGTQLTLILVGDEHMHYYLNVATGEKMLRGEDGEYRVMTRSQLEVRRKAAETRRVEMNASRAQRLQRWNSGITRPGMKKVGKINPNLMGDKSVLVLLVAFSDVSFSYDQSLFNDQFNKEGYSSNGHIGSVRDYFKDQSYNEFNLSFDVYGPVTLTNSMAYYGANDDDGNDLRPQQMVREAVSKANNNYDIDFTKYDWDNDGEVDQVVVIYAGYAESQGAPAETIWPHQWAIGKNSTYRYDGKYVNSYACLSELSGKSGGKCDGIGTFCHEFSHCLGLPDFYDTNYKDDGEANDMSFFDVMASGSYNGTNNAVPCGYTAYERWQFGWVTPKELAEPATISGMKDLDKEPEAYIIYNKKNSNEYFLLENRQCDRWFGYISAYSAGHGLFITHCNYVKSYWDGNNLNAMAGNEHFVYVPANRSYENSLNSLRNAYFPAGATEFTDDSHTSCGGALWTDNSDGTKKLGVPITNIQEANGLISFNVLGGDNGIRYTVTYNAGAGSCSTASWTQSTSFLQATTLPACTIDSKDWTFAGWATASVAETTKAPTLLKAGDAYTPTANVTLYAVYTKTESGGEQGSYTLDYSKESNLSSSTGWGTYGKAFAYTATDGSTWVVKAYKNNGMQINNEKNASIKVPDCPGNISTIEITASPAQAFKFSDTDYTGTNNPTAAATSARSTSATIDLTGKGLSTGYIYTTGGASAITKIVVNYGASATTYYATNPSLVVLVTPTIAFAEPNAGGKDMKVGDTYANAATATATGVELPAVTYASSKTDVATVDAEGRVTAIATGTTTITATVAAVDGQSKAAWKTYVVNVTMPALSSIAVTTEPTKMAYTENDTFDSSGMVVTATYDNGYTRVVTGYTVSPTTMLVSTKEVTISYTEDGVTKTATLGGITVTPLPRYTVTFASGTGSCIAPSLTEESYQSGVTLPACTINSQEWTFAGWATATVGEETTTAPTLYKEGVTYKPAEDVTLYAVYKKSEGTANEFREATEVTDFADGMQVVISSLGTYKKTLANSNGTIASIDNFSAVNGKIICSNTSAIWTLSGNSKDGYTLNNGGSKLYRSSTKVSASNNATTWMISKASYGTNRFLVKDKSATQYLECYNEGFVTYSISGNPSQTQVTNYVGLTIYVPSFTITYHSTPTPTPDGSFTFAAKDGDGRYYATFSNVGHNVMFPEAFATETCQATVKAYTVKVDAEGKICRTEVYAEEGQMFIPASTGVLLEYVLGDGQTFDGKVPYWYCDAKELNPVGDNMLLPCTATAIFKDQPDGNYYYKLAYGDNAGKTKLGFWWGASDGSGNFKVKQGGAVLCVPHTTQARGFSFIDEDDPDAIRGIEADAQADAIYNLAGQRVVRAGKGIYIVNGKKMMIK